MNSINNSCISLAASEDEREYKMKYLRERENVRELQKKFDQFQATAGENKKNDVILEEQITRLLEKAHDVKK